MRNIPAVAVIVFDNSKVLLVKHGPDAGHILDVYGLPAGRIESGELEIQAAVRELKEETGLTVTEDNLKEYENNQYTAQITRKNGEIITSTMRVFIGSTYTGELLSNAETTPEWVEIDNLNSYTLLPNVKEAVSDAVKVIS